MIKMNSDQLKQWLNDAPVGTTVTAAVMQAAIAFDYDDSYWKADFGKWTKLDQIPWG